MPHPDDVCIWKSGFTCHYSELEHELDFHGPNFEIVSYDTWLKRELAWAKKWHDALSQFSFRPRETPEC